MRVVAARRCGCPRGQEVRRGDLAYAGGEVRERGTRTGREARGLAAVCAVVAGALVVVWSAPAGACKPPPFIAESVEFELAGVTRAGAPAGDVGAPATIVARSNGVHGLTIEGLGYANMYEQTASLPAATERYIRRQRRIGRAACVTFIFREPVLPGRYTPETDPQRTGTRGARWTALWPAEVPGVIVVDPARSSLRVHIEREDGALELTYTFTRASFRGCSVADEAPGWCGLLVLLGLRRRARAG